MNKNNKFFNPDEKSNNPYRNRNKLIRDLCTNDIIPKQKQNIIFYKKKPNQFLIHDKNGEYKIVSKYYYFYEIKEDEYDTDTELVDEEWENEVKRIQDKYKN